MAQLVRWDPFVGDFGPLANFGALTSRLNQMLSSWEGAERDFAGTWYPAVDIYDEGDRIVLHAELPGMKKDQFDIRVENNILTLTGERQLEIERGHLYRSECSYGRFSRSFTLPTVVDSTKISATYRDGILRVSLPKIEQAQPHQMPIQA